MLKIHSLERYMLVDCQHLTSFPSQRSQHLHYDTAGTLKQSSGISPSVSQIKGLATKQQLEQYRFAESLATSCSPKGSERKQNRTHNKKCMHDMRGIKQDTALLIRAQRGIGHGSRHEVTHLSANRPCPQSDCHIPI